MSAEPVTSPDDVVHFKARHRPPVRPGKYTFQATHTIEVTEPDHEFKSDPLTFNVLGPRYVLHGSDVESTFPPSGARGQFGEVLPHVILTRATVPWERSGSEGDSSFPWLALLIFSEGEVEAKNLNVGTIRTDNLNPLATLHVPNRRAEAPADVASGPVTIIDVDFRLLKDLLPDPAVNPATHFSLLTHTRQIDFVGDGTSGEERAVVVAGRLPEQGKRIHAHLVSLESCYETVAGNLQFLGGRPRINDRVRLISLYSWEFFCQADVQDSFENLVSQLDRGRLRLNTAPLTGDAKRFLESGFVPLAHRFRQGDSSVSWYHGPLLPAREAPLSTKPSRFTTARAADELLLYNRNQGMFDVSYAAAWELGRLLMLENTRTATALYEWKRSRAQAQAARDAQTQLVRRGGTELHTLQLGVGAPAVGQPPFPAEVAAWFLDHLGLLTSVPFCYLVPDPNLLPKESLRFFFLDTRWMECLFDGAFSVARFTGSDLSFDNTLRSELPAPRVAGGVLLRSAVVSGWPGLSLDGFPTITNAARNNPAPNQLKVLRREQIAPDVLLVLFDGAPAAVDLHLAPETIHFGLDVPQNGVFHKTLRATVNAGILGGVTPGQQVNVPAPNAKGRVDMVALAANVLSAARHTTVNPATLTAADLAAFALEMIESVPVTRFTLS